MSLPDTGTATLVEAKSETVTALLDPAFGFFVWAVHFLVIYIATAVACSLALVMGRAHTHSIFVASLVFVTVAAMAVSALHLYRRFADQRGNSALRFRMVITLGCDEIAIVAIAWQLFAVLLVPLCV
jgi:hypothetical protein